MTLASDFLPLLRLLTLAAPLLCGAIPAISQDPPPAPPQETVRDAPPPDAPLAQQAIEGQFDTVAQLKQNLQADLQHLFTNELHFAKRACQLEQGEEEAIVREMQARLEGMNEILFDPRRDDPQWQEDLAIAPTEYAAYTSAGYPLYENPFHRLRRELRTVLEQVVSGPRLANYDRELSAADEDRKKAYVEYFLLRMDQTLDLSPEQETELRAVLQTRWQGDAQIDIHGYLMDSREFPSFPVFPQVAVLRILNRQQRERWGDFPNYNIQPQIREFRDEILQLHFSASGGFF